MFQLDLKNAFMYGKLGKKSAWSNLQGLLLKGRLLSASSRRQSMALNRVLKLGLTSLAE